MPQCLTRSLRRFLSTADTPKVPLVRRDLRFSGRQTPWTCRRCLSGIQCNQRMTVRSLKSRKQLQIPFLRACLATSSPRRQAENPSDVSGKPWRDLPSQEEGRRSHVSKRFSSLMDHLQSNIFIAGQRLNDLTGYSGIEALKKDIEEQGAPPANVTVNLC